MLQIFTAIVATKLHRSMLDAKLENDEDRFAWLLKNCQKNAPWPTEVADRLVTLTLLLILRLKLTPKHSNATMTLMCPNPNPNSDHKPHHNHGHNPICGHDPSRNPDPRVRSPDRRSKNCCNPDPRFLRVGLSMTQYHADDRPTYPTTHNHIMNSPSPNPHRSCNHAVICRPDIREVLDLLTAVAKLKECEEPCPSWKPNSVSD